MIQAVRRTKRNGKFIPAYRNRAITFTEEFRVCMCTEVDEISFISGTKLFDKLTHIRQRHGAVTDIKHFSDHLKMSDLR